MFQFLRFGAYLFHPLLLPIYAVAIYYRETPKFIEESVKQMTLLALLILLVFLPISLFFLFKNLRWIGDIELTEVRERRLPLIIQAILVLMVLKFVYTAFDHPELYYFFVGVLFTTLTALVLVFFKFKASLHQMGIAGLTVFVIALSIHFQVNMIYWITFFVMANGWVASSRLTTHSHTLTELIIGGFIGALPQILVLNFWL